MCAVSSILILALSSQGLLDKAGAWDNCNIDLSIIARVADRFSPGVIKVMLERMLTPRRLSQLKKRPITNEEILQTMAKYDMVEEETLEAFEVGEIGQGEGVACLVFSSLVGISTMCVCEQARERDSEFIRSIATLVASRIGLSNFLIFSLPSRWERSRATREKKMDLARKRRNEN